MSAVERARLALDPFVGIDPADALRDLLVEIDAHWVDTRELDALLGKRMFIDAGIDGGVVVVDYDHELVAHGATSAEAIRAAREAAA